MSAQTAAGLADIAISRWGSMVRLPVPGDVPSLMAPAVVLEPDDVPALAAMLRWADEAKLAVVPRGAGSKQRWGATPDRVDMVLSLARFTSPIEHCAGDLTATLPAGASLIDVNAALGREGQWLPLDPLSGDRCTIGGLLATNDSGPRRLRYGAPRDLVIGVDMVLADGRQAKAGGQVVKNVAGYDLGRLLCGSFGTLAVLTRATFKLSPLPAASRTVSARIESGRKAGDLAQAIAAMPLAPSAMELEAPLFRLLVRFETTAAAADAQAARLCQLFAEQRVAAAVLEPNEETAAWAAHAGSSTGHEDTLLKVAVLPTDVGPFVELVASETDKQHVAWTLHGCPSLGILYCSLVGPDGPHASIVEALRRETSAQSGRVMILSARAELKARVGPWGDLAGAGQLMRAVKAQFDPNNILNPGGGPGGLDGPA